MASRQVELDGLRGIAVVLVLVTHLHQLALYGLTDSRPGLIGARVFGSAWIGVDVFFVLSGYLITGILLSAKRSDSYWSNFYTKRALRILPAFAIVFSATLCFVTMKVGVLIADALFLANWTIIGFHEVQPLNHIWSLAVEEQFYIFWPLVVRRLKLITIFKVALWTAGISELLRVLSLFTSIDGFVIYKITPTRLDGLAIGAALAAGVRLDPVNQFLKRQHRTIFKVCLVIICLAFAVLKLGFFVRDVRAQSVAIPCVAGMTAMTIFAATHGLLPASGERPLQLHFLVWAGQRSYMVYLLHEPLRSAAIFYCSKYQVSSVAGRLCRNLAATMLVLTITFLLAEISWYLIEARAIRMAQRITRDRGADKTAVGPAL